MQVLTALFLRPGLASPLPTPKAAHTSWGGLSGVGKNGRREEHRQYRESTFKVSNISFQPMPIFFFPQVLTLTR